MIKLQQVYDRGVAAIPLSIDLWLHYVSYITQLVRTAKLSKDLIRRYNMLSWQLAIYCIFIVITHRASFAVVVRIVYCYH